MPAHKSAEKAVRKIARRTVVNKARVNRVRTFVKKAEEGISALKSGTVAKESVDKLIVSAEKEIMRGVSKGIFHKNMGARKVSRLVQKAKKVVQA
jgi:small subunit ribosomal protein S20